MEHLWKVLAAISLVIFILVIMDVVHVFNLVLSIIATLFFYAGNHFVEREGRE